MLRSLVLSSMLMLTCAVAGFGAEPATTKIVPEKEKEIRSLLALTGMANLSEQMKNQMFGSFAQQFPAVPAEFWTRIKAKMKSDDLFDLLMPIYDKYYTLDDLKAMEAFYRSPVGQKVVKTLPDVMGEAMTVGQKWGEAKAAEVIEEMKSSGYAPKS